MSRKKTKEEIKERKRRYALAYRQKLKNDPTLVLKLNSTREKERERKRKKREEMKARAEIDSQFREEIRKKWRENTQRQRLKKQTGNRKSICNEKLPETAERDERSSETDKRTQDKSQLGQKKNTAKAKKTRQVTISTEVVYPFKVSWFQTNSSSSVTNDGRNTSKQIFKSEKTSRRLKRQVESLESPATCEVIKIEPDDASYNSLYTYENDRVNSSNDDTEKSVVKVVLDSTKDVVLKIESSELDIL